MKRKIMINDLLITNYFSAHISVSGEAHVTIEDIEFAKVLFQRFSEESITTISLCDEYDYPMMSLGLTEDAQIRMISLENQQPKLTISAKGNVNWM